MENKTLASTVVSLMDLTSLNEDDTAESIEKMLSRINLQCSIPAAICIYSDFISTVQEYLSSQSLKEVEIATVVNFPSGKASLESVLEETKTAIQWGATEIDLVMPYHHVMAGDPDTPWQYIHSCKQVCGESVSLKVIIESGELNSPEQIKTATEVAILAGADFIKTSTGKVSINATLEAAEVILNTIKASKRKVGFKASGGIRTVDEAEEYIALVKRIMGKSWLNRNNFRFGASSLLSDVYRVMSTKS